MLSRRISVVKGIDVNGEAVCYFELVPNISERIFNIVIKTILKILRCYSNILEIRRYPQSNLYNLQRI